MTETTLALAEALCRAQEAAQSLSEVAPTTAEHWQGVAVRTHAYLLKSGWRITSAPEPPSDGDDWRDQKPPGVTTADDPVSAQAASDESWQNPYTRNAIAAIERAAVRAALEGHEPQMAGDGRTGDEHLGCSCGWEQSSDNDYEPWSRHVRP